MFTAAGFAKALAYWKLFLQGVVCTVCLSFLTVLFGFLLALLITGMRMSDFRPFRALALTRDGHERDEGFLAKLSRFNPIRFIASVYVELFRATPMVVQIMLVYYGLFNGVKVLPGFMLFGFIRFERFFPGVVALALNSGAYLSEIIRSGIQGFHFITVFASCTYYNNRHRTPSTDLPNNFHSIHIRKPQVQQDQIRTIGVQHLTGLCSRIGLDHVITIGREHGPKKVADALLILDHQYFILYERHAAAPPLMGE